ncbi:hypothetical protein [Oceanicella sp. SM1341]|uniref:hypothetical protein n=1 Tax=Oceanicella sp. SM1341 TaxID=1548889 RepID=UPI000E4A7630|nr:hypothetical protein [Oceanicella sp. SM1341]
MQPLASSAAARPDGGSRVPCGLTCVLRPGPEQAPALAARIAGLRASLPGAAGLASLDVVRAGGAGFAVLARLEPGADPALAAQALARALTLPGGAAPDVTQAPGPGLSLELAAPAPAPPRPPAFRKRWMVSMLAVYPALLVLVYALRPITRHLPEPLGLFIVALTLTGLSTAVLVPWLTRRLGPWLRRP